MGRPVARCCQVGTTTDDRGAVAGLDPRSEAELLREIALQFRGIDAVAVGVRGVPGWRAEHRGELAIEVDQLVRNRASFVGIGAQKLGRGEAAQNRGEFPAEIESILHRDVHSLAGLGAVSVAGITGDEDAGVDAGSRIVRNIVEPVAQALPDLVDRPPGDLLHVKAVGVEDATGGGDKALRGDVEARDALVLGELVEFDIDTEHVSALARNDQGAAVVSRLDRRLEADIGKVGNGQDVHHTPCLVGGVAMQRQPQGPAHGAVRAIAADDKAGADRFQLALMPGIEALETDGDGRVRGIRRDGEVEQAAGVIGHEAGRGVVHDIEVEVVHARLIEDDVREFGEPVLDVLNAVAPDQGPATDLVGFPEGKLVDPIGLLHDTIGKAESLEHLHCAAGDAVGLADQKAAGFLLDDAGCDIGERRELRGEGQTGGAAADDEDVNLRRKPVRARRPLGAGRRLRRCADRRAGTR